MKCQYCGAIIDDDSRFCPECGKEQVPAQPPVKLCPFCRAELEEDSVFCGSCGKKLQSAAVPEDTPPRVSYRAEEEESLPPPPPVFEQEEDSRRAAGNSRSGRSGSGQGGAGRGAGKALPVIILVIVLAVVAAAGYKILGPKKPGTPGAKEIQAQTTIETAAQTETKPAKETQAQTEAKPAKETKAKETETKPAKETKAKETEAKPAKETKAKETEAGPRYDPWQYSTAEDPTLGDFQWVTYEIAHGTLPSGIDRLTSFEEVKGGWKVYIIDDPNGEYGSHMERLCRCAFGEDENGTGIGFRWIYVHDTSTDQGYDDNTPDSFYYGPFENGSLKALGAGSVTITDFYYLDGKEYAVGTMTWADSIPAAIFLVRP